WYLNCFAPFQRLQLAHSFKDKQDRLSEINNGLFSYPVLMAADILLYDAEVVPVGKDQMQHLEITRDLASRFNHIYPNSFTLPETKVDEKVMIIPGTDGQKMSKSYNNDIDVFLPEKELRKQILGIQTDSTPLEDPKNSKDCNVFNLYKLIATEEKTSQLKEKYEAGNFGFGHAKQELFELICNKYSEERENFNHLMGNKDIIEKELQKGAEKARIIAKEVLMRVRENIGY
ncbi:MAG TPA: tryptophan--tRNA ligase, partial [Flavobacteriales bacterium]|nr:tryptophan--tRNA ligase [Flavobacteriales bacterium]